MAPAAVHFVRTSFLKAVRKHSEQYDLQWVWQVFLLLLRSVVEWVKIMDLTPSLLVMHIRLFVCMFACLIDRSLQ